MTTTAPLRAAASEPLVPTQSAAAHLNPENLDRAQRALVAKAIAEFSHERLLRPVPDGDGWRLDGPVSSHRFRARRFALDHWVLDAAALTQLGKQLKASCGSGGTVKDGVIGVQGDHRDTIIAALQKQGYTVKRAGG